MSGQVYTFVGSPALVRNETDRILDKLVPDRDRMILQKMTAEEGEERLPGSILSFSMFFIDKCSTSPPGGNQVDDLPPASSDDDGDADNYGNADGSQRHKTHNKKQQ